MLTDDKITENFVMYHEFSQKFDKFFKKRHLLYM